MKSGVLILLTDFGLQDPYVGVMKLVVLQGVGPDRGVQFVDLSHGVPPQNLRVAARMIRCAKPYAPPGSTWLIVVDPGVGTSRRALAFLLKDGSRGVAPDNGVITPFRESLTAVSALPVPPDASPTFHGRDVFAPAAARLLSGMHPHELGDPLDPEGLVWLEEPPPRILPDGLEGRIVAVDRFGNLITNIPGEALRDRKVRVHAAGVDIPLVRTYGDVPEGALLALVGSCGELEISVRNGSARARLGLEQGDPVWVFWVS